jgi:type IV secretory pathway VirB3-like protein
MRSTPVIKALTKPLTIKGCPHEFFLAAVNVGIAVLIVSFFAGYTVIGLGLGLVAFVGLFKLGQMIFDRDPQLLSAWMCPLRRRRALDPMKQRRRQLRFR